MALVAKCAKVAARHRRTRIGIANQAAAAKAANTGGEGTLALPYIVKRRGWHVRRHHLA